MDATFYIETGIFLLATLINTSLAFAVYRNNPKSATNRVYGLLSLVIIMWMAMNFFSLLPVFLNSSLWFIRLSIFFAVAMSAFFLLFARTVPSTKLQVGRKRLAVFSIITITTMLLTLTPVVFSGVTITNDSPNPIPGPGIGLFSLVSTAFSLMAIYILVRKLFKSTGQEREQLRSVVYGISIMLGLIITTVLIPVVLFKFNFFVSFIPLYTIIFLGLTTFAIIRHHLFDIRAAVARSLAYLLSLGFIGLLYGGLVFVLSSQVGVHSSIDSWERMFYVGLALLSAVIYQPVRRFFDRVTNKIFYRDAYDPQVFLDQLNKALVSNIELGILLRHTTSIIVANLACRFALVNLNDGEGALSPRVIGTDEGQINPAEMQFLSTELSKKRSRLIVTEYLSEHEGHLKRVLSENDIAVIAPLVSGYGNPSSHKVAYLMLGSKKSGNVYNKQDLNLIQIIADELVIAIQNALRFEEIALFNVTLQSRINEATEKLKASNEKLKELDETKDEFLGMASHQLRTPLTSVKGYISMVLDGDAGKLNEQQTKLLDQAFASSQRMVYLIADLLNVSRLKTGKFVIEEKPTNLADLVSSEIAQLRLQAKAKDLKLTYKKPANFPELMLDDTKIRQVIMNFADNAIYYTPSGGHITIELTHDTRYVYFMVRDDGLGVPLHEQEHLFTKFYRASNARNARPDGTGLGLFMAKKVVTAQEGQILFESVEGEGSLFGFKFAIKDHSVKN